jgi:hypothetical protein
MLQLLRLIGGVQQDELEGFFETESDLPRCHLGNQDVAALDSSLEDRDRRARLNLTSS